TAARCGASDAPVAQAKRLAVNGRLQGLGVRRTRAKTNNYEQQSKAQNFPPHSVTKRHVKREARH
ncbi:MAG TPA: hypothetical protein VF294_09380, partial [Polyangiaceae bacterium]